MIRLCFSAMDVRATSVMALLPFVTRASPAQPAVFVTTAVDRVSVEPAFLPDEQVVGAGILRSRLQPGPQGRDFIHARAPTHPKQRLRSLEGSLVGVGPCDLHVAPADIGKPERDEFAGAERVQEADQQNGIIAGAPAPFPLEYVEQLLFREVFEGIRLLCLAAFRADICSPNAL